MANYGRDTGEEYSIVVDLLKVGGAIFTGITALNARQKNSRRQNIQNQIVNCDNRISELRSGFLGSWLNSGQIEAEKNKKAELQNQYKKI